MVVTSIVDDKGILFPPNVASNKINVFFVGYITQFLKIIKRVKLMVIGIFNKKIQ
jgi:hypothetical protein